MGKQASVDELVQGVYAIFDKNPVYKVGHDGSDGMCDCIGMIKGSLRMVDVVPSGLTGTNYASRYTVKNMKAIDANQLAVGDVVFKAKNPGDPGYNLPDAYKKGGKYYNGDLQDYSHIGTVTKVNPLEITHMTSPHAMKDTKIGKWKYFGQLPQVDYAGGGGGGTEMATVYADKGSTVNMRKSPSTSSALVERIPIGSEVEVLDKQDQWCYCRWQSHKGYIMTQFLLFEDDIPDVDPVPDPDPSEEMVEIPRQYVEVLYNYLGGILHGEVG